MSTISTTIPADMAEAVRDLADRLDATPAAIARAGMEALLRDARLASRLVHSKHRVRVETRMAQPKRRLGITTTDGEHWNLSGAKSGSSTISQRRRFEYQVQYGRIETRIKLRPVCGDADCVNPRHVSAIDPSDARAEMVERFKSGVDIEVLAGDAGVTVDHMRRVLRDALEQEGVTLSASVRRWPEGGKKRAEVLLREGVPLRWVAEDVGVSSKMVENLRDSLEIAFDQEWRKVQLSCRKTKALAPLHELFNPPIGNVV